MIFPRMFLFIVLKCLAHALSKNLFSFEFADMFSSGSFRECFQASIVLGHPAAPVLPKSRSGMW